MIIIEKEENIKNFLQLLVYFIGFVFVGTILSVSLGYIGSILFL